MDRVKDNTWNPELAVPLIKSSVTVPEILGRLDDQDVITVDPVTGLLALRYFSTVFSISAEEWLELPALSVAPFVPITAQELADLTANGTSTTTGTVPVPFLGPNGEDISEITFKGGNLNIQVSNTVGYPAVVRMTIPGLTLSGSGYNSGPITVPANGSSTLVVSNLASRRLNLGLTPTVGVFNVQFDATYAAPGSGSLGQGLTINFGINGANTLGGPTYAEIKGDFGQQTIDVPIDSVRLRIFENEAGGIIVWDSAIVRGTLTNTFGLGILATLPTFTVKNTETNVTQAVTFPAGTLPLNIPSALPSYLAGIETFELVGNTNGANVNTVLNLNPNRLIYEGGLTANPGAGPFSNFMQDTSNLKLDIEVILPFDGRAIDFSRTDTADVDIFPLDGDVEEIVSVTLRLTIDNGFPADAFAQVYLYDTTGTVLIDSLFEETMRQKVLGSPTPDAFGNVDQTQKVRTVTDIIMNREKLQKLEAAGFGKVVLIGWVESFQQGTKRIRIFEDYTMDLWLGMMVEAKVKIDF